MTNPVTNTQQRSRLEQAYQRKYAEIAALAREQFLPVNLDISTIYTLGLGVLINVRAFRDLLLTLTGINVVFIRDLEDYLLALGHAHALYLAATAPVASIPDLYARLLAKRELLFAEANSLALRGLIPADRLKELRGPIGHSATAFDVLALTTILRAAWDRIQGNTGLKLSEIEECETLADELLSAVGERAMTDQQVAEANHIRQAAFTLFVRAYEELRRGMAFLRWHENDWQELVPSLYSKSMGRRPRTGADDDSDETTTPNTPGTSIPSPQLPANTTPVSTQPPVNGSPPSSQPPASVSAPDSAHNGQQPPVGHPDAPPFTHS